MKPSYAVSNRARKSSRYRSANTNPRVPNRLISSQRYHEPDRASILDRLRQLPGLFRRVKRPVVANDDKHR
jgi:hypothetical protein